MKKECVICGELATKNYKGYCVCDDEDCKKTIDDKIKIGVLEG